MVVTRSRALSIHSRTTTRTTTTTTTTVSSSPFLEPLTGQNARLGAIMDDDVDEYRVKALPNTLKEFVDIIFRNSTVVDVNSNRTSVVWLSNSTFVTWNVSIKHEDIHARLVDVFLWYPVPGKPYATPYAALAFHELLRVGEAFATTNLDMESVLGLPDPDFRVMQFGGHQEQEGLLQPFFMWNSGLLAKLSENEHRILDFRAVIFTSECCRTLTTSGAGTNLGFYQCSFQWNLPLVLCLL